MAECRSCGAPIRWVQTLAGKRIPLNREPDRVRGNVRPVESHEGQLRAHVLPAAEAERCREQGEDLWLAHFGTCPNAGAHRTTPSSSG